MSSNTSVKKVKLGRWLNSERYAKDIKDTVDIGLGNIKIAKFFMGKRGEVKTIDERTYLTAGEYKGGNIIGFFDVENINFNGYVYGNKNMLIDMYSKFASGSQAFILLEMMLGDDSIPEEFYEKNEHGEDVGQKKSNPGEHIIFVNENKDYYKYVLISDYYGNFFVKFSDFNVDTFNRQIMVLNKIIHSMRNAEIISENKALTLKLKNVDDLQKEYYDIQINCIIKFVNENIGLRKNYKVFFETLDKLKKISKENNCMTKADGPAFIDGLINHKYFKTTKRNKICNFIEELYNAIPDNDRVAVSISYQISLINSTIRYKKPIYDKIHNFRIYLREKIGKEKISEKDMNQYLRSLSVSELNAIQNICHGNLKSHIYEYYKNEFISLLLEILTFINNPQYTEKMKEIFRPPSTSIDDADVGHKHKKQKSYVEKYLKYKLKYLSLKQKIIQHESNN